MTNKLKECDFIVYWQKHSCICLDTFGIEYIPQEVLSKIKDKSITYIEFRTHSDDSIMCEFYCIAFREYMVARKALLGHANLFSPNNYKKLQDNVQEL